MRQRDHYRAAAQRELAIAADHVAEMMEIIQDPSAGELGGLLAAHRDALAALAAGLSHGVIHLTEERDDE